MAVTRNVDQIYDNPVRLYYGTAGAAATTYLGYLTGPLGASLPVSIGELRVAELAGPVKHKLNSRGFNISGQLAQITPEGLGIVLPGVTRAGQIVTIGGSGVKLTDQSVKVQGNFDDGVQLTIDIPYVNFIGDGAMTFGEDGASVLPLEIHGLDRSDTNIGTIEVGASTTLEIATGVLTRTEKKGLFVVGGEGDLDDQLDSIAGTNLLDNEIIRIKIAVPGTEDITVAHASGVIELSDSANWIMTLANDWLDLRYDLANTKWVELQRYDAPS